MVTVRVALQEQRDASYDIVIGRGLLAELPALLARHCPAARYAVITDSHVAGPYGDKLVAQLQGAKLPATLFAFPAGEWNKTRETWAAISDRMLGAQIGRDGAVVALGGGVAGDVGGFVAAPTVPWGASVSANSGIAATRHSHANRSNIRTSCARRSSKLPMAKLTGQIISTANAPTLKS